MSTTFGAATTIRKRKTRDRPTGPAGGRYTAARRQARDSARQRSIKSQLKMANLLLSKDAIAKARSARWPFLALFATIAAAAVIALLMLNTATVQSSFAQKKLNSQLTDLTVTEQKLQGEVTAKDSSAAIAKQATQLGMTAGTQPGYLVINPDGSSSFVEPKPQKTPVGTSNAAAAPPVAAAGDPENPAAAAAASASAAAAAAAQAPAPAPAPAPAAPVPAPAPAPAPAAPVPAPAPAPAPGVTQ